MMLDTAPMMYPYWNAPKNMAALTNRRSGSVDGSTSPYPIVVMVITAQQGLTLVHFSAQI